MLTIKRGMRCPFHIAPDHDARRESYAVRRENVEGHRDSIHYQHTGYERVPTERRVRCGRSR